jgi:putative ABC transport system ATP-binding protein
MKREPIIKGEHLVRSFGQGDTYTRALNDLSIDIEEGGLTLLMGPSGSGKTTLLAVLSGLLSPDSGKVTAANENLWALSDEAREKFRLRNCGFIFQGYNLFASLTAVQQVEMVLRWGEGASYREANRRATEILTMLGLGRRLHARPSELSGGEKQRVAIGRALVKDPTLIFADEPTSALDWAHGEQVIELLRVAAKDKGATVVMVAHDARVLQYADQVFYLEDGQLVENGIESAGHAVPMSSKKKTSTPS